METATLPPTEVIDSNGGMGESHKRGAVMKDARLLGRSITSRWNLTEDRRERVVASLVSICTDDEIDPRARVNAGKSLIEADKLNMEQEKREQEIPDRVELTGNVNAGSNVTVNVFGQIDSLAGAFLRAAGSAGKSDLSSHNSEQPVDSRIHHVADVSETS